MRSNSLQPVIHVANVARDTCSTGNIWGESGDGWLNFEQKTKGSRGGVDHLGAMRDSARSLVATELRSVISFHVSTGASIRRANGIKIRWVAPPPPTSGFARPHRMSTLHC